MIPETWTLELVRRVDPVPTGTITEFNFIGVDVKLFGDLRCAKRDGSVKDITRPEGSYTFIEWNSDATKNPASDDVPLIYWLDFDNATWAAGMQIEIGITYKGVTSKTVVTLSNPRNKSVGICQDVDGVAVMADYLKGKL